MLLLSAQRMGTAITEAAFTSEDQARDVIGNRQRSPRRTGGNLEDRHARPVCGVTNHGGALEGQPPPARHCPGPAS